MRARTSVAPLRQDPTFRRGSTGCPGAASTRWWWRRSASPGCSTGSKTLAGSLAGALKDSPACIPQRRHRPCRQRLSRRRGARRIFFGWLTDRLGRKKLFFITLAVYLIATAATAASWNIASFALFRFVTGAGIGGEYAAINSTIQELIPARVRGWSDLVINGSFWVGAAMGALGSLVLLDPDVIDPEIGWRLAFLIGARLRLSSSSCGCGCRKARAG